MSLGFYFDLSRCTGCRACQVACKDRNDLPDHVIFREVQTYQVGAYPTASRFNLAATCNHCERPACVENCPTGACQKAEDGTVYIDQDACIGCRTCTAVCPYSHPSYDEDRRVSGKCDGCKSFRDNGKNPVCVDACPMRAIEFGEVEELRAAHGEGLVSELPVLPSAEETSPNLLIRAKEQAYAQPCRRAIV